MATIVILSNTCRVNCACVPKFREVRITGARRFYFVGGAAIPWQFADLRRGGGGGGGGGGASIGEGASTRDLTVYIITCQWLLALVME